MNCPTCNSEMRYVQAGVSKKTGRPYNAFYSCPNNCKKNVAPVQNASTSSSGDLTYEIGNKQDDIKHFVKEKRDNIRWQVCMYNATEIIATKIGKGLIGDDLIVENWRFFANKFYESVPDKDIPF